MKRKATVLWFFLFFILISTLLHGAYLTNVPIKVVQPDGQVLNLLASGDEFYNWLHDRDGYTIVQNPDTGFFVYAYKQDGKLFPSSIIVSTDAFFNQYNLMNAQLPRYLKHDQGQRRSPQEIFPDGSPADIDQINQAPKTGTLNNIVIFIRFSDESEFADSISTYNSLFNASTAGANSMYNFFREASYNQLSIPTTFYPIPSTTVLSYQDSLTRAYYQTYNVVTNPIGYQDSTQRRDREHTLLKNAVDNVSSQIPPGLNVDGDGDNLVDNVCFVVYGGSDAWADLLWPHMWSLYSQTTYINGKRVYTYNFNLQASLVSSGVGVLCHEMFHSLGAPDLYHYNFDGLHPVYTWGLMEYNSNPPRHMGAFMKHRYGTWISSIPEITTNGWYTLNPLTSTTNNCYKIASPNSATEYFVVEYRRKNSTFENSLPGEGLLVYRINSARDGQGNASGPPDEVYIYRPNGTTSQDGIPVLANFSSDVSRTLINDSTNPSSFLSDGSPGTLNISGISSVSGTISFYVGIPDSTTISGYVRDSLSQGIGGVVMNGLPGNPQTDSSGYYSAAVNQGWSGTVTPIKAGYSFSPLNMIYSNVTSEQSNQDYTGTPITHAVSTPTTPAGVSVGETNTSYAYTTGGALCSQGHPIQYQFDWGDGSYSVWSSLSSAQHSWTSSGSYTVRAHARCLINNLVISQWSSDKIVDISVSPPKTSAIAYLKKGDNWARDFDLFVRNAPTAIGETGAAVASDYVRPNGETTAVARVDIDGDGIAEIAYLKKGTYSETDFNLVICEAPESQADTGAVLASDYVRPNGETVGIAGVDIDGDGIDEIAYLKKGKKSDIDYDIYICSAPTTIGETGTLIASDYRAPNGETAAITGVDINGDGVDEIAYLKKGAGSPNDYNLYIYNAPTSKGESTSIVASDYWAPNGETVAITSIDIDGDSIDEMVYLKKGPQSAIDYNLFICSAPTMKGERGVTLASDYASPNGDTRAIIGLYIDN